MPNQNTRTFPHSSQRNSLSIIKPDFVLIEFGFVDAGPVHGYHTTLAEFEANLRAIVQTVRDFNGTPILITPTGVRYFDAGGRIIPVVQDRCEVVRRIADDMQTYLSTLINSPTSFTMNSVQRKRTSRSSPTPGDSAHFSLAGANRIATLVVEAFPGCLQAHVARH